MLKSLILTTLLYFNAQIPAQEYQVSAYLDKASEHASDFRAPGVERIGLLYALDGNIDAAFRFFESHDEIELTAKTKTHLQRIAILKGQKDWLIRNENKYSVDWNSDAILSAVILRAAIDGNIESIDEQIAQIKDRDYASRVLTVCIDLLKKSGYATEAKSVFVRLLNHYGDRSHQALLNAAIIVGYRPMIREFYRRWSLMENVTDKKRYRVLSDIGHRGYVEDAFELLDTLDDEDLRKSLGYVLVKFVANESHPNAIRTILNSYDNAQDSRFRDSIYKGAILKLLIRVGRIEEAEDLIDEIAHKIDRVPLFARLAHTCLDQGDVEAAERNLNKAIDRLKTELRNEATIQYSSQMTVATSRPLIATAAMRLGEEDTAEEYFSLAIDRALALGRKNTRLPHHAVSELYNAFLSCDQPERAIE